MKVPTTQVLPSLSTAMPLTSSDWPGPPPDVAHVYCAGEQVPASLAASVGPASLPGRRRRAIVVRAREHRARADGKDGAGPCEKLASSSNRDDADR
jgi:hypothetical protein